ncbi:hypothetical protein MKW92_020458 [Papaver armeniacum]|nr:hypothetical protein MKW92_020458 [Papaver armeniacum]
MRLSCEKRLLSRSEQTKPSTPKLLFFAGSFASMYSFQSTLKRIGVNAIPSIKEVNIFKDDVFIQFQNHKVQASIAANTWVVSGSPQTKKLQDLLPGIINQLGKKLAEQFQKQMPGGAGVIPGTILEEDDDDVPELMAGKTFEAAAYEEKAAS